jgi:hypothetical protein
VIAATASSLKPQMFRPCSRLSRFRRDLAIRIESEARARSGGIAIMAGPHRIVRNPSQFIGLSDAMMDARRSGAEPSGPRRAPPFPGVSTEHFDPLPATSARDIPLARKLDGMPNEASPSPILLPEPVEKS